MGAAAAAVVMAVLALVAGALLGPAPAGAQEYGAVCSVAASYDEGEGVLRVVGTGLEAGFTTPIVLDGETIGEATADADGFFEVFIPIELVDVETAAVTPAAVYVVSIVCNAEGDVSSTTVTTSAGAATHVIEPAIIDCAGNLRGFVLGARRGTEVTFTLDATDDVLAVVEADADGRAPYAVVVQLEPGPHGVTARGQDAFGDAFTLTTELRVPAACGPLPRTDPEPGPGPGGGPLPRTGAESEPLALAGVGAVGVGALALVASRRRRTDPA